MATALDDFKPVPASSFNQIPTPSTLYPPPSPRPLYELRHFDVSSPLVVKDSPPRPARGRINPSGIPGDVEEMLSVFDACLQVGKLDRAALVLNRFARMDVLTALDQIRLHNRYLRARLQQIQDEPGLNKAEDLHKWYELRIRGQELPQTAETIACMLKASLLTARGSRLERLVDRYMGMVPGEAGLEVLYMSDILTDQDLATITHICQTYNLLPEEMSAGLSPPVGAEGEAMLGEDIRLRADADPSHAPATPDVLSTPQKGMGLRMLKQTLSLFSDIPEGRDISGLPYAERREIQSRLERDCVDAAVARWREENQALLKMGLNSNLSAPSLSSRLYEWQTALEKRLTKEMEDVDSAEAAAKKNRNDMDRCLYGPIIRQSHPSRLAAVTILSTLSSLAVNGADKGVPLTTVVTQLAKVAEEEIRAQRQTKARSGAASKAAQVSRRRILRRSTASTPAPQTDFKTATAAEGDSVVPTNAEETAWPATIRTKIGAMLLSALIESAKVTVVKEHPDTKALISQIQPAFSHANILKRGRKLGILVPNRTLVDLMKREPRGDFLARHLPMVVEPEPWSKFDKGGFVEYPASLVRIKYGEKDQRIYTEAALARGDMDQVLKGLDVLGRTAWRINRPVFDVMLQAWNTGEEIANIPPLNPNIPIPPEPDASEDPMQRRVWIRSVKAAENEKSGLHSVRCFMNFQLEIARAFRDQTFYFPHNIDFRGRAYPVPTYLNHMGADHVRGLMSFAKGKALGENGLRWLKVHLANVFGYDKASLSDREGFAMDNLENIRDSVDNPLKGKRWWLKAEDPWQCLAACYEIKAAMDLADPTQHVSHLPVHQDGTCNGLQHYAALGGDTWGARQVNLEPGDRPADVYSAVAELVKENITKDIEQDNPFAKALQGKITRKVVKQTVMTNVYGVTFSGAKKQVLKQIDALYPDILTDSGIEPMVLASYVAVKIFKALSTMFKGAHDIQYWLGEIGGRVCCALTPEQLKVIQDEPTTGKKSTKASSSGSSKKKGTSTDELLSQFRSTLVWTTPLRMPVVQPYRKSGTRTIQTCLQFLVLTTPERSDPVHRRKQLQAFPPNFIHSLDASHMILSALQCDELGLTFAAVHDSFWTHAADVDTMNAVIRDSFIRIHSEDVIGRLAAEFEARYRGSIYLAKLSATSAAGKQVAAHRKASPMSLKQELLLEKRRQELLRSDDPAEVAQGAQMVTPASIVERSAAEEDLAEPEDNIGDTRLGTIPDAKMADMLESGSSRSSSSSASSGVESEEEAADDETYEVAEAGAEDEADSPQARFSAFMDAGHFASTLSSGGVKKPAKRPKPTTQVWLPLTLPAIPKKGDFDVQRLKSSKYFFS